MSQALQLEHISRKFHHITEEIEGALSHISYDKLDISDEVREQVIVTNLISKQINHRKKPIFFTKN